jgi:hypothetical protein
MTLLSYLDSETGATEVCDLIASKGKERGMAYMLSFYGEQEGEPFEEHQSKDFIYATPGWMEYKVDNYILLWNTRMSEVYFLKE